jgi:hypothetical protein
MTTQQELPLPTSATPKLKYRVILEGAEYTLLFQWMSRSGSGWYISMYDNQDVLIYSNIKLVPWFDFLSGLPSPKLPIGELGLICTSMPSPLAPDITPPNLSTDFKLMYYSPN